MRNKIQHIHYFLAAKALRQSIAMLIALVPLTSPAEQDNGRIKSIMHTLVLEYAKMSPYMADQKAFESKEGKAQVGQSLKELDKKIKLTDPKLKESRGPGFKISYSLLSDFVGKTKEVYEAGEMEHARARLNGMGNICASCHMQAPKISKFSAFEFVVERNQNASFENANFLFVIRRYDEALAMLDGLIRNYPKSKITSDQLGEAYRQKISILVRVFGQADRAVTSLQEDLKNKELPADVQQNVKTWLDMAGEWKKETAAPEKMTSAELVRYAELQIPEGVERKIAPSNPKLFKLLRISGMLYNRLFQNESGDQTQAMLYLLARCERSLAPLYWYSLNEIYLKECVVQYPKQAYSKKCFEAYKQGMEERYMGGLLPEGVKASIESLKRYL